MSEYQEETHTGLSLGTNASSNMVKPETPDIKPRLQRLYTVAKLMDSQFKIPVVGRVGLDPVIGLIPFAGDLCGYLVSCYIIVEAARLGVPANKLGKMSLNAIVDGVVGYVPVAGDLIDITYKANARNVNIVLNHFSAEIDIDNGEFKRLPVEKLGFLSTKGKIIVWLVVILVILLLALLIAIPIMVTIWLFSK